VASVSRPPNTSACGFESPRPDAPRGYDLELGIAALNDLLSTDSQRGTTRDDEVFRTPRHRRVFASLSFYPTLYWNFILGRIFKVRRWWDRIDPHVIVGAYPFARDVPGLHKEGVRAIVNTCEEYCGPTVQYNLLGIEQLRIPTTDFTHPRLIDVELAVEFVQSHVEKGHTVYIHCKAGRARSATVAICWLMKYRGMSIDDAQLSLLASRAHVNPRLAERHVVKKFAELLKSAKASG